MKSKVYFVYDKETNYILSGFDCCVDDHNDNHNIYTRPYKTPYPNAKCRLDFIFNESKKSGLKNLKYDNMVVETVDHVYDVKTKFVENPNYLDDRYAVRGWWKITDIVRD